MTEEEADRMLDDMNFVDLLYDAIDRALAKNKAALATYFWSMICKL